MRRLRSAGVPLHHSHRAGSGPRVSTDQLAPQSTVFAPRPAVPGALPGKPPRDPVSARGWGGGEGGGAAILQYGDYPTSGNDSKSSQKMAPPSRTDLLAHPRQFAPAAFAATRELIGSSPPRHGGTQWLPAAGLRVCSGRLCSGRRGAPSLAGLWGAARTGGQGHLLPLAGPCSQKAALRCHADLPSQRPQPRPAARKRRMGHGREKWGAGGRSSHPSLHQGASSSAGTSAEGQE